jgi:hypothetical protein
MIIEFFQRLVRQRVQGVQISAKSKVYSAQARVKGKASTAFNKSVDGVGKKAKGAVIGGKSKSKSKDKSAPAKKKKKMMGLFGRKKDENQDQPVEAGGEEAGEFGEKTQLIQVGTERPKECVGWIVALNGPLKGLDFRLVSGKNVIGTAADCDIVITDQFMSARHAVLRHDEGSFVLLDLDSTNGSFVNDTQVSKEELIDNDRVRLGKTDLKFKSLY